MEIKEFIKILTQYPDFYDITINGENFTKEDIKSKHLEIRLEYEDSKQYFGCDNSCSYMHSEMTCKCLECENY